MFIKGWHTIVALTAVGFAVTLAQIAPETWMTTAALSLSAGVTAVSCMGLAALLGARIKWVESAFGGLDRVYLTHKWLGVSALVFACVHFTFKAGLPAWETASILVLPGPWTRLVRQLSLVALIVIVTLALNRKIPYHLWRWWHKLSGPLFIIVVLHWLSFKSPIAIDSAAGAWLSVVSVLGVGAAAYKLLLYEWLSPHSEYRVVSAVLGGAALHLELEPVKHPIRFTPGQFAFLSLKEDGLREPHPFTIASAPNAKGCVQFVIRDLGDYTKRLISTAAAGMRAIVYAPFGRFARRSEARHEIWIAGGVGITPFIAWLQDEVAGGFDKVTLFYFFTPGREFPRAAMLEDLAARRGARFVAVAGGVGSAAFQERFAQLVRQLSPADVAISFCGPKGLLEKVRESMHAHGVPESSLRYEYFEFR